MKVHAQFVDVGERKVLVRHAGRGPALVLLHQSPQSSAALAPWIEKLSERFAVFAPDTPGFGKSDPLPLAQPTIPDLAAALGALLRALGLQRVLLYGVHTGAAIAARLARDEPQQVAALVCDGLSAFSPEERQALLDGYLPPFEPAWDGTHLLWLWARIREQTVFFPWHVHTQAARLVNYPRASTEKIHADAMDLLEAGDGYRAGYRAPLLYEHGAAGAAQIQVPAWLLYREADVLRPHLDRLPTLPAHVVARSVADGDALLAEMLKAFDQTAAGATTVNAKARVEHAASKRQRIVDGDGAALSFHLAGPGDGPAELVIGDLGKPAAVPVDREPPTRCLAVEWPGHGASPRWPVDALGFESLNARLTAALGALGVGQLRLRGQGAGAAWALSLAQALGPRCTGLTLIDPLPLDADERERFIAGLPDPALLATGAHLIAAWNWARGKELFWPWGRGDAASTIACAAPPPRRVHAEAVEILRAGELLRPLWRQALALDWAATAATLRCPIELRSSSPQPERLRLLQRLADSLPR